LAKLIIVMGTTASGKSHFIDEHFGLTEFKHISIGEYQRGLKSERELNSMSMEEYFNYLAFCNEKAKIDMVEALEAGQDVILEHTLYKAKRRIVYTEAAKAVTDEPIDIYVMQPSKERLRRNLKAYTYGDERAVERFFDEMSQIEFPNPVEGFDKIFSVTDGEIRERVVSEDLVLVERAKEELRQEAERLKKEQEEKEKGGQIEPLSDRQKLIKELEYKPFWHICEVCGKKEFMTAEAAYIKGWDYPPKLGKFGIVGPRTCGNCGIEQTVWWNVMKSANKNADEDNFGSESTYSDTMTPEHKRKVIMRIAKEPYSLLEEEEND